MSNEQIKKDSDSKKILTLIVLIGVLMITTTSATYAYFAFSATATNNMTGTAATASLVFQLNNNTNTTSGIPSLTAPTNSTYTSKPMIPQYAYNNSSSVLSSALTGASGKDKCVDGNGNVICRVYTFTIRNNSTATVKVNGKKELLDINMKPEVVDPDDIEMLQDLVISVVNEALRKVDEAQSSQMSKMAGGMNIPGLF